MHTRRLTKRHQLFAFMMLTMVFTLSSISVSAQYPSFFVANLDGGQQAPASQGTAFGRVTLDDTFPQVITVRISISYSGLQGKATMIQVFGPAAENEPPTVRFTVGTAGGTSGFVRNRQFGIPEANAVQAQLLRAGLFYFVIKTTLHPQGEISGPIVCSNPYVGTLNGAQNGNSSTGAGFTRISLNASETKMMVSLQFGYLPGGQSAVLYGPGTVVRDLGAPDFGGPPASGAEYYDKLFDITPAEVSLLKANGFFAEVSTTVPNSNIKGRIQAPGRGRRRSDFDADGTTDIAVWRPSNGIWYALQSTNSAVTYNGWGTLGDEVVSADYDGDGQTDRAVFRAFGFIDGDPVENVWLIEPSSTYDPGAVGNNLRIEFFGLRSDKRLPHDYDGDGQVDLAVFRYETGFWYIMQSSTKTLRTQQFGEIGGKPFPGDYDGDHKTDLAVLGVTTLQILRSSDGNVQSVTLESGDPAPRDYDGDGKTDVAVVQGVGGNSSWRIRRSSDGVLLVITHGLASDRRVPADYDGDGKVDVAVWRASDSSWRILQSSNGQVRIAYFGMSGDELLTEGE